MAPASGQAPVPVRVSETMALAPVLVWEHMP
jgi:hypothetical protein